MVKMLIADEVVNLLNKERGYNVNIQFSVVGTEVYSIARGVNNKGELVSIKLTETDITETLLSHF